MTPERVDQRHLNARMKKRRPLYERAGMIDDNDGEAEPGNFANGDAESCFAAEAASAAAAADLADVASLH